MRRYLWLRHPMRSDDVLGMETMNKLFNASVKLLTGLAGVGLVTALLYGKAGWRFVAPLASTDIVASGDFTGRDTTRNAASGQAGEPLPSPLPTGMTIPRYQLHGVVAEATFEGTGVALISIDGDKARPYRVGAAVGDHFVLLGVSQGGAILGPPNGPPEVVLDVVRGTAVAGAGQLTSAESATTAEVRAPQLSAASDLSPMPEVDPAPDAGFRAPAPSSSPSPGRRLRLHRSNPR